MKNARIVMMMVVVMGMIVVIGCTTPPVRQVSYTPVKVPVKKKGAANWKKYTRASDESFKMNHFLIKPVDLHAFDVSGIITDCSYTERVGECTTHRSYVTRNTVVTRKNCMPSSVLIRNSFGDDVTAIVKTDGSFSARVILEDKYYSHIPSSIECKLKNKYFWYLHYKTPKKISIRLEGTPGHTTFKPFTSDIVVYWVSANMEIVKRYIDNLRSTVNLEIMDRISRVPVAPDVVITGTGSFSGVGVEKLLVEEFEDEKIVRDAMAYLSRGFRYVKKGKKKRSHSQTVSFGALKGFSYKIETTHGKYYYFSKVLNVKKAVENKNILLVDGGSKIRQEDVKEGEGGSMVDSD